MVAISVKVAGTFPGKVPATYTPATCPSSVKATPRPAMQVKTYVDRKTMSAAAAGHAASLLRDCIAARGPARIIAATGASQIEFLESLVTAPGIDWSRVEMFHLDEYVGLPSSHPASFRRYLLDRLIRPTGMSAYHLLDGEQDAQQVADRIGERHLVGCRSMSRSSELAKTVTWPSMTRPPILRTRDRILSSPLTRRAGASRSVRAGSRRLTTCHPRRSRCRSLRS